MYDRIQRNPAYSFGFINDYVLVFNKQADNKPGVGYANIKFYVGGIVWGLVYDLIEEELSKIDEFEGVKLKHYNRISLPAHVNDKDVQVVAYIADPSRIQEGLLPDRKYLSHLLAAENLLPFEYVKFLKEQPTID